MLQVVVVVVKVVMPFVIPGAIVLACCHVVNKT
jgi:hypothetical protein